MNSTLKEVNRILEEEMKFIDLQWNDLTKVVNYERVTLSALKFGEQKGLATLVVQTVNYLHILLDFRLIYLKSKRF